MRKEISYEKMYSAINDAIAKCYNVKNISAKERMLEYVEKYNNFFRSGEKLDLFDEWLPTEMEVKKAQKFCSLLNKYRLSIDIYNEKSYPLQTNEYQYMYDCLQEYRPHISQENQETAKILEKCIKRNLPQYREEVIIDEYNQQALILIKQTKSKGKNNSENARKVLAFFKSINEMDIKSFKASPLKIELYTKCIDLINHLPKEKYGRVAKFDAKIRLNKALYDTCLELGGPYLSTANFYLQEEERFKKAKASTNQHLNQDKSKIARDEYLYK